jgi:hypothetical protein
MRLGAGLRSQAGSGFSSFKAAPSDGGEELDEFNPDLADALPKNADDIREPADPRSIAPETHTSGWSTSPAPFDPVA